MSPFRIVEGKTMSHSQQDEKIKSLSEEAHALRVEVLTLTRQRDYALRANGALATQLHILSEEIKELRDELNREQLLTNVEAATAV